MDLFTIPDSDDPGMGYAYLAMTLVFIAASFSVHRFKKANKKKAAREEPEIYEMYETKEEHEQKQNKDI
ncbi:hypothetical protein [Alkalicoccus daliensis]|uniref:Uncharacterized protein n=1 Tax=Alkalicoccus daliensis TaxID=745820 RepID=A0A1H0IA04_9BACI|nr:hypothetical protein [Alkalicoccus daliensis]SDO28213.1 hypothetical protein SAMN04488053_11063 [Alkalicoccus daliensis]